MTTTTTTTPTTTTTTTTTDLPADLHVALDRVADALTAIFAGDPAPYAALWAPGTQPTLFGAWGPTEKGHDAVVNTFDWVASRFSDGLGCRPCYEVVDWSGDLAYTVGHEEVQVRVDGGPPVAHDPARHPCPAAGRRRVAARAPPCRPSPGGPATLNTRARQSARARSMTVASLGVPVPGCFDDVCGVTAPGLPSSSGDRHRERPL